MTYSFLPGLAVSHARRQLRAPQYLGGGPALVVSCFSASFPCGCWAFVEPTRGELMGKLYCNEDDALRREADV